MLYVTNFLKENKLVFNSNTVCYFENYIGFQYYAVSNLNSLAFKFLKKVTKCHLDLEVFKAKQRKLYNSQLRF